MRRLVLVLGLGFLISCASAGQAAPELTLAERLGYPPDAKLLIIHADDLGMAHSVNAASIAALESGAINSASIMVPCPWFPEIAAWARDNPDADLGLHLTLTSEWPGFRWGPVLSKDQVPSLLDETGYFHRTESEAAAKIDPKEAEAEIRAQIDRARASGIEPTHLDTHMRTLHQNRALFAVLLRVSREYGIPAALERSLVAEPELAPEVTAREIVIDRFASIGPDVPAEGWDDFYSDLIRGLEPGVTELIVHVAYDDAEMRAAAAGQEGWGSSWRQRDLEFLGSDEFRGLLLEHGVRLITWREIGSLMRED